MRRACQDRVQELLEGFGYRPVETPILEPTELFLRKSGGALASQMYSFTDSGNQQVSLRPEFTAPIMRHYLEHASGIPLPARFQYAGPVFRFEENGRPGQFTQAGAELIGASGVAADAEIISVAAQVPACLGISGVRLALADAGVLHGVLDALNLSDRAKSFVLGQVSVLRRGTEALPQVLARARELNLAGRGPEQGGLAAAIAGLDDSQARQVLEGLFRWQGGEPVSALASAAVLPPRTSGGLGQRNSEDVVERLLRKLRGSDTPEQVTRGLELVAQLAPLQGTPPEVLERARPVLAKAGANESALDRLSNLAGLLEGEPDLAGQVQVDFGLVRELAYYNGLVFQAACPSGDGNEPQMVVGGGGRYDGLARALGSRGAVPALGFAYNLESLMELPGVKF